MIRTLKARISVPERERPKGLAVPEPAKPDRVVAVIVFEESARKGAVGYLLESRSSSVSGQYLRNERPEAKGSYRVPERIVRKGHRSGERSHHEGP